MHEKYFYGMLFLDSYLILLKYIIHVILNDVLLCQLTNCKEINTCFTTMVCLKCTRWTQCQQVCSSTPFLCFGRRTMTHLCILVGQYFFKWTPQLKNIAYLIVIFSGCSSQRMHKIPLLKYYQSKFKVL